MAAVSALIPLAGNVVASLLTDWTGRAGWLVVPAVGVAVAMITALIEAYGSGSDTSSQHRDHEGLPGDSHAGSRPSQERGGTPLVVALVISVVVIGIGGLAVAEGTRSLITEADLPPEYVPERSERFSSPSRCARLRALPGAPRSLRQTLSALGLKRCEWVEYHRRRADDQLGATGALIFVLRDEQAASKFLPVLRRVTLATMQTTGDVVERRHSFSAPSLGDEALRGVKVVLSYPDFSEPDTMWFYFWRRGDVVAGVAALDVVGDFDRLSTLDLAAAVDARIAD